MASPGVPIPYASSAGGLDPEPLLSPSAVSILCQERMFLDDEFDESTVSKLTEDGPSPSSEGAGAASTSMLFEDARSTVTMTDIEERLKTASLSGSIHELQEETVSRKSSNSEVGQWQPQLSE
jgi:hypothetical protein